MKGSGEVIFSILLVILMIAILYILLNVNFSERAKRQSIIFDETNLFLLKNIFSSLKKTLSLTWEFSLTQAVYDTFNASAIFENENLPIGYWYKYNPAKMKTNPCVDTNSCGYKTSGPRVPQEKCNHEGYNPRICKATFQDFTDKFPQMFQPYTDITNNFVVKNVNVKIKDISYNLNEKINHVSLDINENISLETHKSKLKNMVKHSITINSSQHDIIMASEDVLKKLVELSDEVVGTEEVNGFTNEKYDECLRYRSASSLCGNPSTFSSYFEEFISRMRQKMNEVENHYNGIKIQVKYNTLEYIVPSSNEKGAIEDISAEMSQDGLLLHYDIDINVMKDFYADTADCVYNNSYDKIIEREIKKREWDFRTSNILFWKKISFDEEEIMPLVKAIIWQGSKWDKNKISPDGRIGLMQLSPLLNPSCSDLTDPEKNIECGIDYLHKIFKELEGKTDKRDEYIKLVLAAYYSDVSLIKNLPSNDLDSILSKGLMNHIISAIGDYVCYGGPLDEAKDLPWYYNGGKIIPRPFGIKIKAEDYLKAIDCSDGLPAEFYADETHGNAGIFQMFCCNGQFYTCGIDLPGIENNKLSPGTSTTCSFYCFNK